MQTAAAEVATAGLIPKLVEVEVVVSVSVVVEIDIVVTVVVVVTVDVAVTVAAGTTGQAGHAGHAAACVSATSLVAFHVDVLTLNLRGGGSAGGFTGGLLHPGPHGLPPIKRFMPFVQHSVASTTPAEAAAAMIKD